MLEDVDGKSAKKLEVWIGLSPINWCFKHLTFGYMWHVEQGKPAPIRRHAVEIGSVIAILGLLGSIGKGDMSPTCPDFGWKWDGLGYLGSVLLECYWTIYSDFELVVQIRWPCSHLRVLFATWDQTSKYGGQWFTFLPRCIIQESTVWNTDM